jgi:hypothetical protein
LTKKNFSNQFPAAILASCIILSGHQASNFIWSFQLQWSLFNLFLILSIIYFLKFLESENKFIFFICFFIASIIASFSSASGNVLWFVVLIITIINYKKIPLNYFLYLFISGFIFFITYWSGIKLNFGNSDGLSIIFSQFFKIILYYLAYLGGPFSFYGPFSGVFVGSLFLIGSSYQITKLYLKEYKNFIENFSFTILVFILLNAIVVSIGRLELGLTQAVESIYSSVVLLGYAALLLSFLPLRNSNFLYVFYSLIIFSWIKLPYDYFPLKQIKNMATSAIYIEYYNAPELKVTGFNSNGVNLLNFLKSESLGIYKELNTIPYGTKYYPKNITEFFKINSLLLNFTKQENDLYKIEGIINSNKYLKSHKILFTDSSSFVRGIGYFDFIQKEPNFYGYLKSENQTEFNIIVFDDDFNDSYLMDRFILNDTN